ncbi:MAG TPA: efflux RND transporter permease subunit [Steroidobacteraceae bacterium]|jgi:HAE1 family hydrophobic/amphiphilic exporter-1|nr:efflux RND transporter permease subunit [Steroidobacteraceae bacterium]
MFLSNFSIRQPVTTVAIIIVLMCLGLLALTHLRVNQIPDVDMPIMVVTFPYPGASPESVERDIINRVEKSLQSIPQIYELRSTASDGQAQFVIMFDFKKDMTQSGDEVRNAIAGVRYKLPLEMREPVLFRVDPSADPIMNLGLSSTKQSHAEISRLAEDVLADQLRGLDGVAVVDVDGSLNRELSVLLHAQKLREYNVSAGEVVNALRAQNTNAPVGRVKGALDEQNIRLVGRIESPREFNDIVVKRQGNEVIRLGQLATVEDGFAEPGSYSLRSGRPNVGLSVIRQREASTVTVAKRVREKVEEINKTLPEGTKLEVTRDGGEEASDNLGNVIHALIFGAGLTIFVVYAFLNSWRSTLITGLSLPTSAIAAFIAVWLCGFTLNFMTLLGLSLAIGVLIDDAIVVRENIVRHMQRGEDRVTAARNGTAEIGLAVSATTFSIVAVFVPVAFMGGGAGEWFRPFAVTVVASVLVSLFISFTLDPMLSAYWGDPPGHEHRERKGIEKYFAVFNTWFDHQADRYGNVIAWALHHRKIIVGSAIALLFGALAYQIGLGGSEFLPKSDYGTLAVEVRTPSSTSLEYARNKVEKAAELARAMPETKSTDARVNATGGRVWVDVGKKGDRSRSLGDLAADLRQKLSQLVGAEYTVFDDLSQGARKKVQIQFYGTDSRKLMDLTNEFMDKVRKIPGAVDVGLSEQDPKDELRIELDRGLANQLGISVNDAAQTLRVAFAGVEVGDWVDPVGESRDVAVRLAPEDRVSAENIEHLPIAVTGTDMMVPLEQIARVTMDKGPARINHLNGKRTVTVAANVQGVDAGTVTAEAMKIANAMQFPPGFGLGLGGASRDQQELFTEMFTALIMGIFVMYLVLVMQFNSFTAPIAIMLSLPLSLIGVVLALNLTGGTLNLMSFIGVIMLMGLVAKNAILLLDCAREEERNGVDREEALMHAGRQRLRPILMTTFALIAGMMPVAIGLGEGGEFYSPMAVAIIGGTIVSTLLTLLVVPSFYDSIEINVERMSLKFRARATMGNPVVAFLATAGEWLMTMLLMRFIYRLMRWIANMDSPPDHPVERAARIADFKVPENWKARPQWWQRQRRPYDTGSRARPDPAPKADGPYGARPVSLD